MENRKSQNWIEILNDGGELSDYILFFGQLFLIFNAYLSILWGVVFIIDLILPVLKYEGETRNNSNPSDQIQDLSKISQVYHASFWQLFNKGA